MIKKIYQNGVKIVNNTIEIIISIQPIVIGNLSFFINLKIPSSPLEKVPKNIALAPIKNIVGAKYGTDM